MSAVVSPGDHQLAVGEQLRAVRRQQGLSLHQVEDKSAGRWKAVVVGAYERGDRAVNVERLAQLATFYGVPMSALLPAGGRAPSRRPRLVISLPALTALPREADAARRYVQAIREQRGDWAGEVLSLRADDVLALAALLDTTRDDVFELLSGWQVLAASSMTSADELDGWAESW